MSVEYLGKVTGVITSEKLRELMGFSSSSTPTIETVNIDISWMKFSVDGGYILVADRWIVRNISWNTLNSMECIAGKEIFIDGKKYTCRSLTGHNGNPDITDESEWKKFIVDLVPNDSDSKWKDVYTFCQETNYSDRSYATVRGYSSASNATRVNKSTLATTYAWRPVLESQDSFSIIGVTENIGDITSFNQFNYTVTNLSVGNFNLVEKVDGQVIRTLSNQSSGTEFTFNIENFDSLSYGNHVIEIIADDPTASGNVVVTSKFNKIKSPVQPIPTSSNLKQVMLHNKELEKEISYQNFRFGEKLKEKGVEIVENESLSSLINKIDGVHQALNVISESTTDRIIMCSSFSGNDVLASDKIIEVFGSIRFYLYYSIDTQGYQARVLLEHIRDGKLVQSKLFTTYEWGAKVYYDIDNVNPGDRIRIFVPKVDRPTKITNASIRYEYSSK